MANQAASKSEPISNKELIEAFLNKKFFAAKAQLDTIEEINHSVYSYKLTLVNQDFFEDRETVNEGFVPKLGEYDDLALIDFKPSFENKQWSGIKKDSISKKKCDRCYGQKQVPCGNCKATGRLYNAAQKKYYDCHNCQGTGKVNCPLCQGDGVTVGYINGVIKHSVSNSSQFLNDQPLTFKTYKNPVPIFETTKRPTSKELSKLPQAVQNGLMESLKDKLTDRVIQFKLSIEEYPVKEISYLHKGKNFSIFYDNEDTIMKSKYPLNKPLIGWMSVAFINMFLFLITLSMLAQ